MGRIGTQQRPHGTVTRKLSTTVLPSTWTTLHELADRNATTLGKMLDGIAIAARKNQQKPAHTLGSALSGRIGLDHGEQTEAVRTGKVER